MSEYDAFGELYDKRPKVKIAARLKNSKSALELVRLAQERNLNVEFTMGGMRQDVYMQLPSERERGFTVIKASDYLKAVFPDPETT